jgi:hypothetical protein
VQSIGCLPPFDFEYAFDANNVSGAKKKPANEFSLPVSPLAP